MGEVPDVEVLAGGGGFIKFGSTSIFYEPVVDSRLSEPHSIRDLLLRVTVQPHIPRPGLTLRLFFVPGFLGPGPDSPLAHREQ